MFVYQHCTVCHLFVCVSADADEVLLFERATFLVISCCERKDHKDPHRLEKVSNIIKQFKLSCRSANPRTHTLRSMLSVSFISSI